MVVTEGVGVMVGVWVFVGVGCGVTVGCRIRLADEVAGKVVAVATGEVALCGKAVSGTTGVMALQAVKLSRRLVIIMTRGYTIILFLKGRLPICRSWFILTNYMRLA